MEKIIISILLLLFVFLYLPLQIKETNYQKVIKRIESPKKEDNIPSNYLGIVEIESIKIKNIIQYGTQPEVLNNWFVGLLESCDSLEQGPIILAGHNIPKVFRNLHQIKKEEKIVIKTQNQQTIYWVTDIKVVNPYDMESIKTNDPNMLILITCTQNDKKRLIVYAKKV